MLGILEVIRKGGPRRYVARLGLPALSYAVWRIECVECASVEVRKSLPFGRIGHDNEVIAAETATLRCLNGNLETLLD
jgi:hypothetical protein